MPHARDTAAALKSTWTIVGLGISGFSILSFSFSFQPFFQSERCLTSYTVGMLYKTGAEAGASAFRSVLSPNCPGRLHPPQLPFGFEPVLLVTTEYLS